MIQQFTLKNFKSFKEGTLKLSALTLMVGANASGKSNALEAIRFLSWLAQGRKLSELQYQVNQDSQVVRGITKDMFHLNANTFSIECQLVQSQKTGSMKFLTGLGLSVKCTFDLRKGEELHLTNEACENGNGDFLYRTVSPTKDLANDIKVEYNNFARGGKKPQITCSDQQAIFTQLTTPARFEKGHKKSQEEIPDASNYLSKELAEVIFLDPRPSMMRESANKQEKRLKENGSNLSSVLYHLWQQEEKTREAILSFIQSLPEQDIKRLEFLEGFKSDVLLQVVETFGGKNRPVDTSLLSDGTLRALAVAAALLSAPQGSMVIIEELDNGIHPSRTKSLLEKMFQIAKERDLTVLISSHNPALMDALPQKQLPEVVFCYRDPKDGSSKLVQLKELNRYPELIAQGTLGDLVTEGILDRFVKTPKSEEERKSEALKWLETIK